jgi:hypothetical protein
VQRVEISSPGGLVAGATLSLPWLDVVHEHNLPVGSLALAMSLLSAVLRGPKSRAAHRVTNTGDAGGSGAERLELPPQTRALGR